MSIESWRYAGPNNPDGPAINVNETIDGEVALHPTSAQYYNQAIALLQSDGTISIPAQSAFDSAFGFLRYVRDAKALTKMEFEPLFLTDHDYNTTGQAAGFPELLNEFNGMRRRNPPDTMRMAQIVRRVGYALWIEDIGVSKEQLKAGNALQIALASFVADKFKISYLSLGEAETLRSRSMLPESFMVYRVKSGESALTKVMRVLSRNPTDKPSIRDQAGFMIVMPEDSIKGLNIVRAIQEAMNALNYEMTLSERPVKRSRLNKVLRVISTAILQGIPRDSNGLAVEIRIMTPEQYAEYYNETRLHGHRAYAQSRAETGINNRFVSIDLVHRHMLAVLNGTSDI